MLMHIEPRNKYLNIVKNYDRGYVDCNQLLLCHHCPFLKPSLAISLNQCVIDDTIFVTQKGHC